MTSPMSEAIVARMEDLIQRLFGTESRHLGGIIWVMLADFDSKHAQLSVATFHIHAKLVNFLSDLLSSPGMETWTCSWQVSVC